MKKTTPIQCIIKMLKTSDKGKILKTAKEHITYIETEIRIRANSLSETIQIRRL